MKHFDRFVMGLVAILLMLMSGFVCYVIYMILTGLHFLFGASIWLVFPVALIMYVIGCMLERIEKIK
jgi:hypothetical protein